MALHRRRSITVTVHSLECRSVYISPKITTAHYLSSTFHAPVAQIVEQSRKGKVGESITPGGAIFRGGSLRSGHRSKAERWRFKSSPPHMVL